MTILTIDTYPHYHDVAHIVHILLLADFRVELLGHKLSIHINLELPMAPTSRGFYAIQEYTNSQFICYSTDCNSALGFFERSQHI